MVGSQTAAQGKGASLARSLRGFRQLAYTATLCPVSEMEERGSDGPGDPCTCHGHAMGDGPTRHIRQRKGIR